MKKNSFTKETLIGKALLFRPKLPIGLTIFVLGSFMMFACKKVDVNPSNKINTKNSASELTSETYDLKLVADNFVSPLGVVNAPDGTGRLFVIDQIGKIWIIRPDGTTLSTPFLDISSKLVKLEPSYDERGLLGLFIWTLRTIVNSIYFILLRDGREGQSLVYTGII